MSTEITKRLLTWGETSKLIDRLTALLSGPYDAILVITRGGMIPACLISERMDIRNIMVAAVEFYRRDGELLGEPSFLQFPDEALLRGKRVLVVDDVWDSGHTAMAVRNRARASAAHTDVAVLHYKPGESRYPEAAPDFYAEETNDWIVYPWDAQR